LNEAAILHPVAAILGPKPDEAFVRGLGAEAWVELIALAHRHRLVPALHEAFLGTSLAAAVPKEVRDHAAAIATLNGQRNAAVREEIRSILTVLNAAGLEPVLLKGAAALVSEPHALPGRMLGDIDMLVAAAAEADALASLQAAGYRPASAVPPSPHTIADLGRPGTPALLDLHRGLLDPPFQHLLPAAVLVERSETLEFAGLRYRVPMLRDYALHLLLHAQILSAAYYERRLDLGTARALARLDGRIDWAEVEAWTLQHGLQPILHSMLLAARDAFGLAWPLRSPPDSTAIAHYRRACTRDAVKGSWDTGLGPIAKLREGFAPDRLAAAFGRRSRLTLILLQIRRVLQRNRLPDAAQRLFAR
jgi:hypothetical protein